MSKMFGDLLEKTQAAPDQRPKASRQTTAQGDITSPEMVSEPSVQRTTEPSNEGTKQPTFERTVQRTKVRHTFDVFKDQVLALGDIQQALARRHGTKPRLGDLVQEALDSYIREKHRTNDDSKHETFEPTKDG